MTFVPTLARPWDRLNGTFMRCFEAGKECAELPVLQGLSWPGRRTGTLFISLKGHQNCRPIVAL